MDQPGESRLESFLLDSAVRERDGSRGRRLRRGLLLAVLAFLLLGWYWSLEPARPALATLPELEGRKRLAAGVATTAMLEAQVRTLLEKPGGYVGNDLLPPGVWLDNMAAFERGAMMAARDLARALRRDFSHAATGGLEDPDLLRAEPRLAFDGDRWLSSESEYGEGIAALAAYRQRLASGTVPGAQFHPRADALVRWLDDVDARLAEHVARLAAATQPGDAAPGWSEIDDAFYEARGYAWALRAQQDAIAVDFTAVLAPQLAAQRQLMRELDGTQQPMRSPFVLNGSEYGLLANHSLVMAGYLARARNGVQQLRMTLQPR